MTAPSNGFLIRSNSYQTIFNNENIEVLSIDDFSNKRSKPCMSNIIQINPETKLSNKIQKINNAIDYSKTDCQIEKKEATQRGLKFGAFKRVLKINGCPSDMEFDSRVLPLYCTMSRSRNSRNITITKKMESRESKFAPKIDLLRLNPQRAKINHKSDDNFRDLDFRYFGSGSWIDSRWVQNCDFFTDFSPLHSAVFKKDVERIKKILSHESKKVSKEIFQEKDSNNLTAIHWAVILGNKNILKTLLNQINPEDRLSALNMEDERGWSVFRWAIEKQYKDLINCIFSELSDVDKSLLVTKKDEWKQTSIHYAIKTGNKILVKLFLEQILFDNDKSILLLSKDLEGQTIFHLAATFLDNETFEMLVELIPDKFKRSKFLQEVDNLNQTPLHKAAMRYDISLLKVIMKNILAEDKQKVLKDLDSECRTALHLAILYGGYESVNFLLDEIDTKDLKSYVMMKDNKGKTAFHYLFYENQTFSKISVLLQKIKECSKDSIESSKIINSTLQLF